jgi:hypothetical protein
MADRLLDRQASLLEYLTSSDAIFGETDATLGQTLQGIDRGLLRLEARFSHGKRMARITAVFPRTFEILGDRCTAIVNEFVKACPPSGAGRLDDALQFYDFVLVRLRGDPPLAPYLRDVAACELACANVRVDAEGQSPEAEPEDHERGRYIRRHPGTALLRCVYDIRPIFEDGVAETAPIARDTPLVVGRSLDNMPHRVFEVAPAVFDLLIALAHWTDSAIFRETPEVEELIGRLIEQGLVEAHE